MNSNRQSDELSKTLRRTANERLLKIEGQVGEYAGRCLFLVDSGEYCDEPVTNNCHIVSESAVLDGMKDDKTKKVLELQWGVSQWRELLFRSDVEQRVQDTSTFEPSERTTSEACMGKFACKIRAHDDAFRPIDVAIPNFKDPVVRFLSAYRLVLFLADQCRHAIELHQKWEPDVMRNSRPRERAQWLGEKAKLNEALRRAEEVVMLLGKVWHARETYGTSNLDVVSAQVLNFRSKLKIAGSVNYGRATGVTVYPIQGEWHKMFVLYLTSVSDTAGEDVEHLASVASASEERANYGVTVTSELMTRGWGSLAMSPKSYEGLNSEDRLTIQRVVARHSRDMELVKSLVRRPPRGKRRKSRHRDAIS